MARATSLQAKASTKRLAIGFMDSATTLWAICTKQTIRVVKKLRPNPSYFRTGIIKKTACFGNNKRVKSMKDEFDEQNMGEEEYGIWQRSIMMGDKCEPLDFSGLICYDSNGKQVNGLPVKSPRASPIPPGFHLNTMVEKRENEI